MGTTILLVYATWAIAPVVAYQALMAGLNRQGRNFALLFGVYAAALAVTVVALRNDIERTGSSPVSMMAVILPGVGIAVLSAILFWFGRRTEEHK